MSDLATEALEALLVRYKHELNSLQPEDFTERIRAWQLELEATVTADLRGLVAPISQEIDRCLRELQLSGRAIESVDYNALDRAVNLARNGLQRQLGRGSFVGVREEGSEYGTTRAWFSMRCPW